MALYGSGLVVDVCDGSSAYLAILERIRRQVANLLRN